MIKARAIRRVQTNEQWDKDMLLGVKGIPKQPVPGRPGDYIPTSIAIQEEEEERGERITGCDEQAGEGEGEGQKEREHISK